MKKFLIITIYIIGVVMVAIIVVGIIKFNFSDSDIVEPLEKDNKILNELEAVSLLKIKYPEFTNYPNESLPPQSIRTEKDNNGWYVSFVQEGSGRPVLFAKCFFINNNREISSIGEFKPAFEDINFDIKNCKSNRNISGNNINDNIDKTKNDDNNNPPIACTMDAKMCPDGTYVGRSGPKCEFVCP